MNTDAQALDNSMASNRVQMGLELTRGLGKELSACQAQNESIVGNGGGLSTLAVKDRL